VVAAAIAVAGAIGGAPEVHRRAFKVPYGEVMTAADYAEIVKGEEAAVVLERLDESGRPERLTAPYVLVLFPPPPEDASCTYWEFSEEPQIFARLCFSRDTGELVQKLKHNVLHPPPATQDNGQFI
jgi:hypothetical protein